VIGHRESPDGLPFFLYERKGKWAFRLSAWTNSPGLIAEIRRDAILRAIVRSSSIPSLTT
jgi:hypothetical protein